MGGLMTYLNYKLNYKELMKELDTKMDEEINEMSKWNNNSEKDITNFWADAKQDF